MSRRRWKSFCSFLLAAVCCLVLSPRTASAVGPTAEELVGKGLPFFSLATNQDRLADYQRDYYGKHHLILTFFPAAFTPV